MKILFLIASLFIIVPDVWLLKCRTREHMKQQQDFYNLASTCMKSSMNVTQQNASSGSSMDYRPQRPSQQLNQHYHQQNQQYNQQQYQQGNGFNFENHYDTNRYHNNKPTYDQNRPNFGYTDEDISSRNPQFCINPENYNYRDNSHRDEMRYSRYRNKRDVIPVQKYVRKNSTNVILKKSPLEEIGSCIIHCIFREMKMLNNENKADRLSMTNIMTSRIRDSELKEFIQDSIEECFDIIESDNHEEPCDLSKKLILCLEEKAKRGCEDWEVKENPTQTMNFTLIPFDRQSNDNKNDGNDRNTYTTSNKNNNNNNNNDNNNGYTRRYPNFQIGQRKQ